jgi:DNA-binding MarR family transcriptional regulator
MLENLKSRTGLPPSTVSRPELLHDGSDSEFRQLVHDLLAFSSRLQEIRSSFGAQIGLTGIQYTLLISIRHLGGSDGAGVKAVAEHLSLSSSFVTVETKKLIARGLLNTRPGVHDRRRVQLTVSEQGEQLLAHLLPLQQQVNDALFQSLGTTEFDRLCSMAEVLKNDAEKALRLAAFLSEPPTNA